ncbi:MAG TPA: glycosyltransferase [Rectinema sp.]|nr:glycosyltransferase [Rectinema sp.]HPW01319.1 glycosyltransferase [Rectinema sp.]
MRILHIVTNSDLGGAPRVVTELSARAAKDGHTCAVAAAPDGPMWRYLDVHVQRFPVYSIRREIDPLEDLKTFCSLQKLYGSFRPDIIHLHSSKAGVLGRLSALSWGIKYTRRCVYTIHGFDTILKAHNRYLPLERMLARATGAVVPVSHYDERNLRAAGICKRVVMIPNGVTNRRGMPSPDLRAASCIAEAKAQGKPIVLTIARLESPKRPDLFVDIARKITKASFFWVGNVQNPTSMLPAGTKIPENLFFLGESPEAGTLANLCDIFMLLSDYEGAPMSILEAMSCAKPVVASNVGGIPEILGEGSDAAGILVPNKPNIISNAVLSIIEKPSIANRLGAMARQKFESSYSADHMWESYLDLYKKLSKL